MAVKRLNWMEACTAKREKACFACGHLICIGERQALMGLTAFCEGCVDRFIERWGEVKPLKIEVKEILLEMIEPRVMRSLDLFEEE